MVFTFSIYVFLAGLLRSRIRGSTGRRRTSNVLAAMLACATLAHDPATADEYRLSVGDVVSFDFVDDTLPADRLTVSDEGDVNLPYIGAFRVGGLTVAEAHKAFRAAYTERQLLIDPQISLSMVGYRPIFVLGDVKAPGSFAYQPTLTVEHAVALAGGQSVGSGTAEDRLVTRARLQGDLDENAVEIAREMAAAARAKAELAGRTSIETEDLPSRTKGLASVIALETLLPTERRTLETTTRAFETRRKQLTEAIDEVVGALANLKQLSEKQKTVIATARADAQRAKGLVERGLKTVTDLSSMERDATSQEAQLLQIFNQTSTVRRELGDLQRQLVELTEAKTRMALSELQKHSAEIERLFVARRSTEDQLSISNTLSEEQVRAANTVVFTYRIRRKVSGSVVVRVASLDDLVAAGDTILVTIERPDQGTAPSLAAAKLEIAP